MTHAPSMLATRCQLPTICQHKSSVLSLLQKTHVGNCQHGCQELPTEKLFCLSGQYLVSDVGVTTPSPYGREHLGSALARGEELLPTHPPRHAVILALDLGTVTGWALRGHDAAIASGSQSFRPHRFEGGGMRYLRFKQWLTEVKQACGGIHQIYFEEVRRHSSVDAAHAYGGFMAHLTAWCEHHGIPYLGVPVGTIKRFITGKGNADKQAVIRAVTALGFIPADDNEADALALLHYAINHINGGLQ